MKQIIFILIFAIGFTLCGCESKNQKTRNNKHYTWTQPPKNVNIEKIVSQIESGNRVTGSHIGITGSPSDKWALYEKLKSSANDEQLIHLTDHKNGAVRCYAFQALASHKSDKLFPVLLKHLYDTSRIETQSGCIIMTEMVGDYFLNTVTPGYVDLDVYKLNTSERRIVDSILINDKNIFLHNKFRSSEFAIPKPDNSNL